MPRRTDRKTDDDRRHSALEMKRYDARARRAERETQTDLRRPLRDGVRDDAIDADGGGITESSKTS